MMIMEAIFGTCCVLPGMIFFRNHPPNPPSKNTMVKKIPFGKAIKQLFKKHDYKYQTFLAMMQTSLTANMVVNLNEYLNNFGIPVDDNTFLLTMGILGAVVGAVLFGYYV